MRMETAEMLAVANIHKDFSVISSDIYHSLRDRGLLEGLGSITLWEYWCLLLEEAEWIRETRF
jgi:hypothetical protein